MTTPIHTALLETAIDALERAERLHRQFFRLAGQPSRTPVWEPPIEVFEHDGQLATVDRWKEALRCMRHEVVDRQVAREDERHGSCE